jgi:hypothetical protein
VWSTLLTGITAVAAVGSTVAAVVAIYYARKTVNVASAAEYKAHSDAEEEIKQRREQARDEKEMHETQLSAEYDLEGLRQLNQATETVLAIATTALYERDHPPKPFADGRTTSRIPPLLNRLVVSVKLLVGLGVAYPPKLGELVLTYADPSGTPMDEAKLRAVYRDASFVLNELQRHEFSRHRVERQ